MFVTSLAKQMLSYFQKWISSNCPGPSGVRLYDDGEILQWERERPFFGGWLYIYDKVEQRHAALAHSYLARIPLLLGRKKKKKYLFWNFSDIATVCMPSTGFLVLCSKKCGVCLYFQSPSPSSCLKLKKEFPVAICRAALIISFKSHLWYTQLIAGLLLSFEHFLADQYCHIASLCSPVCLAPSVVSCFILKL